MNGKVGAEDRPSGQKQTPSGWFHMACRCSPGTSQTVRLQRPNPEHQGPLMVFAEQAVGSRESSGSCLQRACYPFESTKIM